MFVSSDIIGDKNILPLLKNKNHYPLLRLDVILF
jgi:hypothetical protein